MNLNLDEKIDIAVKRLLKMKNLPAFSDDYLPLYKSAKEAMLEVETYIKNKVKLESIKRKAIKK